jgi:metallophosphoesterase superfamily enzyme
MRGPAPAASRCALAAGAFALAPGFVWLEASRVLVAADAHLGYEDVMGGALPLWSTAEIAASVAVAIRATGAREVVFLGDVVHGAQMSEGAARTVAAALDAIRAEARVTLVAGNHEGRTRARAVLGETVEACERDGWLLVHGDVPARSWRRSIIGHLHPSLHLGGGANVPAFLAGERLIVVPALTPYSAGLSVLSRECAAALERWGVGPRDVHVVAAADDRLYPFGALPGLRAALERPGASAPARTVRRRRFLGPDR